MRANSASKLKQASIAAEQALLLRDQALEELRLHEDRRLQALSDDGFAARTHWLAGRPTEDRLR